MSALPPREGASFDVTNPATGTRLASVAEAGAADIDRAVAAATAAYGVWGALSPVTRGRNACFAALVEEHTDELALLECRNVGMPIGDARGQLGMIVDVLRYYAGAVDKFFGHTIPVERDGVALTFREPIGVVGLITPWNFPLNIANWKIAPALAGRATPWCSKPASLTPLSVLRYAELAAEAGIPPGALNVVPGTGRDGRKRAGRAPRRRQDRLHGLHRGGLRHRPARRRDCQAGDARAGRQVGVCRLRGRRPREGRPGGAGYAVFENCGRTAAPVRV